MSAALAVRGISVVFGGLRAVSDLTLELAPGERRAIIGPNGAGKTTLFNTIGGQTRPQAGRVELLGRDVTRMASYARARAGLGRTFQVTNLLNDLSVFENILLAVAAQQPGTRVNFWRNLSAVGPVVARAEQLLEQWNLAEERDVTVGSLAYGQQRVLEIALAMASDPKVLLLDEPTAGVSTREAALVVDVVSSLPKTLTILLIEHDMDVAFSLADTVTVMTDGLELATGPPDQIQGNQDVIDAYLGGHGAH